MHRVPPCRLIAVAAAVVVLGTAVPAHPIECIDYSELPGLVGRDGAVTSYGNVTVFGDYALVSGESAPIGLWIVDVRDPQHPGQVGFAPLTGTPGAVAVLGDIVYVACGDAGVQILDLSAPASPAVLGSIPALDRTDDLVIAGGVLWTADWTGGFVGFDLADPAVPVEIVRENAEPVELLAVEGSLLVAMWQHDDPAPMLWTWDITVPTSPVLLGGDRTAGCNSWQYCTSYRGLELRSGIAYSVSNSESCFDPDNCYDIDYSVALAYWNVAADPANLHGRGVSLARTRNDGISGTALTIEDDRAYVVGTTGALYVIDLSDPLDPIRIHAVLAGVPGRGVAARSTPDAVLAFAADAGLSVYDVSHPELPDVMGGYGVDQYLHDVAEVGGIAYTSGSTLRDWPGSLTIRGWDLTNPANPVQLFGTSGTGYGYVGDLEVASGDLYRSGPTSEGASLFRSEILAGGAPGPQTWVFGTALDSEPVGSHLLVATGSPGLSVLETFPDAPPISIAQVGTDAHRVVADGDLAIVLEGGLWPTSVLHTVDISDPTAPVYVGQIAVATPSLDWIALRDGVAVAGGSNLPYDLHFIDVSVPAAPALLSSVALPGESTDGSFSGSTLYSVLKSGGCVAIDVRVPSQPVVRGMIPSDPATAVLARNSFVLVGEGGGLSRVPIDCPTAVGVGVALPSAFGLRAAPNPFRGSTTILWDATRTAAQTRVGLYDARGRHVRDLVTRAGGRSALVWDGRDAAGLVVAPGVYFLRLENGTRRATTKVTRLR